jgi:hypothetical protein
MQGQEPAKTARYLRVKVVDDSREGRPAVNIKVPIGVVKWGMQMAQAFSPQMKDIDLDWDSIDAMVQEGETGKIVEVEDEAEHKTVEVWLELLPPDAGGLLASRDSCLQLTCLFQLSDAKPRYRTDRQHAHERRSRISHGK